MEFLVLAILLGLIPAFIASSKGHGFVVWWIFGALLFIVALPISFFLAPAGTKRKCPLCTKTINAAATVCPYCARDVPPPTPSKPMQEATPPPLTAEQLRRQKRPFKIAMGVFSLVIVGICIFGYLHRNDPVAADSNCSAEDLRTRLAARFRGIDVTCSDLRRLRESMGG